MSHRSYLYNSQTGDRTDPHWYIGHRTVDTVLGYLGLTPRVDLGGRLPALEIASRCEAAMVHAPAERGINGPNRAWHFVEALHGIAMEDINGEIVWGM